MLLSLLLLLATLPCPAADEAAQVHMLKEIFRSDQADWLAVFEAHRDLLDDTFFDRCQQRIDWGLQNYHVDDAIRFAIVADLAARVVGRPQVYRDKLAEALRARMPSPPSSPGQDW